MSTFNSIRDISAELLKTFKDAGVKLTEGQKADIDGFIKTIEKKINETKMNTVKATKKVVEENIEKEMKPVLESLFKNITENNRLASKLQKRVTALNESKRVAKAVDSYLDLYLKDVCPTQKIVDYDKLNKLQTLVESMKDMLVVSDDAIESKKTQLAKEFKEKETVLNNEIVSLKKKLNESMGRELKMKRETERVKAAKLLNEKTDDLPVFEARRIRKKLEGATCEEIESKFRKIYEEVEAELAGESKIQEKSLEEEINNIIAEKKPCVDEECNEKIEKICDKTTKREELPVEVSERKDEEEDDEELLTESEKIDSRRMSQWIGMVSSSSEYRL